MKFDHQIYSNNLFRPKPEIHFSPDENLLIVATPWGNRNSAKKAIQTISDFVNSSVDDPDFTSPFSIMSCISSLANHLRIAVMLANDTIYQEDNKNEYTTCLEIVVIMKNGPQISWAHVGHPQIFLSRQGLASQPISTHYDISLNYSEPNRIAPPLAGEFIGVYPTSNINVQTIHVHSGDSLLLLSRSEVPESFFGKQTSQLSVSSYIELLTNDNPGIPFWIGKLDF
ncbi:MAG: hypothetical protein KDD61_07585 [Bdellovibrionales bacterium]|nr:hypothetical protein [Bdellovibrionales bacterium]